MSNETICEHVDMPRTALCVVELTPPGHVGVYCPCCGLSGNRPVGDNEPMRCPYCDVDALIDDREEQA